MLTLILFACANKKIKDEDNFFVFEPDIRLFTSYAFMNAAGYNHDWNPTMHPIRTEIRNLLLLITAAFRLSVTIASGDPPK